jgi:all-trans-retinol 13,14-reductase
MIQSYKKSPQLADSYDAILIGSGLGCLTTAALLSQEGQKVLVLERHYTAGGYTHVFKRKGYEWDVGIHYVGEMHRSKSIIRKLFDHITDGKLEWADMGEVYDRIVIGDKVYDFVKGVENWKEKLISYFPEEEEAIEKYVNEVFLCVKQSRNFYLEKAMTPLMARISGNMLRAPFLKYSNRTTREVLEEITQNQELIKVLTGQYGDYGLPPAESSFAMHAALVRHYFSGGYFPVGGSSRIMETIDSVLEQAGSTVLVRAEVDEVIVEGKKAVGVRMEDGREFRSPVIISGAGVLTTFKSLLPEAVVEKHNLTDQIQQVKASAAHACLYMGLNGSPEELQLPKANYWIYPDGKSHEALIDAYLKDINEPFPLVYVSFPAAKDPDWNHRYPGKSTIDIITLMPYDVFQPWEGDRWKHRGEGYDALKEKISQRLMEALFKLEPQLRGKVDYYELSTPVTTRHFMNYESGEIYGIDHGPDRFQQKFLRPHTPIKNFYLTGQDIVTAGIGGALFSGLLTASAVTGKNLLKKIM